MKYQNEASVTLKAVMLDGHKGNTREHVDNFLNYIGPFANDV